MRPTMIAITAALLSLAPGLAAQQRALTPAEQAAGAKVDDALARQDFVSARALLTVPELAQVVEAHVILAQLHASGRGGPVDQAAANQEYRRAAELGHMRSAMVLAERLEQDPGAASKAEARSWFTVGANGGDAHALAHLGRMAWEGGDKSAAFTSWAKAAPRDGFAASCLGMIYTTGQGANADQLLADYQFFRTMGAAPSEGLSCVETAGAGGNVWAQYLLGQWYSDKKSELYDPAKAVEAFAKAAANGHGRAAYALAQMLDKGDGIPRNAAGAYQNYLRAANDGNTDAWRRLAAMALAGDGYPRNVADAINFLSKDDTDESQYQLGLIYAGGEGWPPEMTKAVQAMAKARFGKKQAVLTWLKARADQGNAEAQYAYGAEIQYSGDLTDAVAYFEKAVAQGLPKAKYGLAMSGMVSGERKISLLQSAANAGDARSMYELSLAHRWGRGVAQDPAQSRAWAEKAFRAGDPDVLLSMGENYWTTGLTTMDRARSNPSLLGEGQAAMRDAIRFYEAAHGAGNKSAAGRLARLYDGSISGFANDQQMLKWLTVEASRPGAPAETMQKLAEAYEQGRGTPVDLMKAWFWLETSGRYDEAPAHAAELWRRLSPGQQSMGERLIIGCKISEYKRCKA